MLNKTQIIFALLFSILLVSSVSALTAVRSFSDNSILVSETITVSITVDATGATVYGVDEFVPTGWTVSNINEAGSISNGKISWLFLDNTNRVLTYKATAPASSGTYNFNGNFTDGTTLSPITGAKQVTVNNAPGSSPTIKINEIEANPNSGNEWIELYNPNSFSVDISGWKLYDNLASQSLIFTIPSSTTILAKGYYVADLSSAKLNNGGDFVTLKDSSDTQIDQTLERSDNDANSKTWQAIPDGSSTWQFVSSTKGLTNQVSNPDPEPSGNTTDDLMVNYVRGKIIIDGNPATSSQQYTLTVLSGENSGETFTGFVDLVNTIPAQLQGLGYFDTRDQIAFSTGSDFKIEVSGFPECSQSGTFLNGGNGWFSPESGLLTLNCNSPNNAPTFDNSLPTSVQGSEGEEITFQVNATDLDNDSLTFSASGLLSAFFNAVTRIFSWTPGFSDSGTHQLQLTVSDGENSTTQNVTISVSNTNRAPILNQIENQTIEEDTPSTITLSATDPDLDSLSFSITSENTAEVDCSISGDQLTLNPALNFNGIAYCTVQVSDGSLTDSQSFSITVTAVNDAPSIIGLQTTISADEGSLIQLIVNASDPDNLPNELTITINDTRFTNPSPGIFEWQTNFTDSGTHKVEITVSDGSSEVKQIVTITIIDTNQPPILDTIPDFTILEDSGENTLTTLSASDIDGTISGFSITSENKNEVDCSISPSNELKATPANNFFGTATCTVTVTDNSGGTDSQSVSINVTNVNDAPIINSISPTYIPKIPEDASFDFSVDYTDIDSSESQVTITWLRNGTADGSGKTYTFTGDGTKAVLVFNITVLVSDGEFTDTRETQIITSNIPLTDVYNGDTTPFDPSMPDSELECVDLVLEVQDSGKVVMIDCVDLRDVVDLDRFSKISSGLIALDSSKFMTFKNKRAMLTMFSLSNAKTPSIKYNSGFTTNSGAITQTCPGTICSNISYDSSNNLEFQITGFSSFSAGPTPSCSAQGGDICSASESCFGSSLTASDSNACCSISCVTTPPKFSGINTCGNISSLIDLRIKDPDKNDEFDVGETMDIELKIKNLDSKDHDYDIEAHLYNADTEDSEEDVDENLDVNDGDTESIDFDLEIPEDLDEGDRYVLYVKAEDGNLCTEKFVDIDIERPDDYVIISNFQLLPPQVSCGGILEAKIKVQNLGSDDQDIVISAIVDSLGIRQDTEEFELEQFDDDDKETRTLLFQIPYDAKPGDYTARAEVSFSGEVSSDSHAFKVVSCGGEKKPQSLIDLSGSKAPSNQILLVDSKPMPQPSVDRIYLKDYSGFDLGSSSISIKKTGTVVRPVRRSSSILSVMISATESALVKWLIIGIFILITLIFITGIFGRRFRRFR
jgi:hypothetical protein